MYLFIPGKDINAVLDENGDGTDFGIEYKYHPSLSSQLGKLLIGEVTCNTEPIRSPNYDSVEGYDLTPHEMLIDISVSIMANAILSLLNQLPETGTISQVWCVPNGVQLDVYYSERAGNY